MRENRPSRAGVVRAMARSDHWRWVSTPRCSRVSSKVVSMDQRWTYHPLSGRGKVAACHQPAIFVLLINGKVNSSSTKKERQTKKSHRARSGDGDQAVRKI